MEAVEWVRPGRIAGRAGISVGVIYGFIIRKFDHNVQNAMDRGFARREKNKVLWSRAVVDQAVIEARAAQDAERSLVRSKPRVKPEKVWPKELWPVSRPVQSQPLEAKKKKRCTQSKDVQQAARKELLKRLTANKARQVAVQLAEQLRRKKSKTALAARAEIIGRNAFFESDEWEYLRRMTLAKYGCVCMCCGATNTVMHVDHIRPRSRFPELSLDPDNLQVLCKVCNEAKSDVYVVDYRPDRPMRKARKNPKSLRDDATPRQSTADRRRAAKVNRIVAADCNLR